MHEYKDQSEGEGEGVLLGPDDKTPSKSVIIH